MTNDANAQRIVSAPKAKKRKIASLDAKKSRAGWIFVLPFVLGFVLVYLPIIWNSIYMSFHSLHIVTGGGYTLEWVGLDNYKYALFQDASFVETLVTGLGELAFDIPAILIFSLFMAVMLNEKMVGRAAFRAIFFIPVILSTGIMANIDAMDTTMEDMEREGIRRALERHKGCRKAAAAELHISERTLYRKIKEFGL